MGKMYEINQMDLTRFNVYLGPEKNSDEPEKLRRIDADIDFLRRRKLSNEAILSSNLSNISGYQPLVGSKGGASVLKLDSRLFRERTFLEEVKNLFSKATTTLTALL